MSTKVKFVPKNKVRVCVCLGAHVSVDMREAKVGMSEDEVRFVSVKMHNFQQRMEQDNEYSYLADESLDLALGDVVLCDTKFGACLGKVIDIPEEKSDYHGPLRSIIQKIDINYLFEDKLREFKIKEIKSRLSEMKKKFEEQAIYEMLAASNPAAAELLAALKGLGG